MTEVRPEWNKHTGTAGRPEHFGNPGPGRLCLPDMTWYITLYSGAGSSPGRERQLLSGEAKKPGNPDQGNETGGEETTSTVFPSVNGWGKEIRAAQRAGASALTVLP